jgi:hypothetical protein
MIAKNLAGSHLTESVTSPDKMTPSNRRNKPKNNRTEAVQDSEYFLSDVVASVTN